MDVKALVRHSTRGMERSAEYHGVVPSLVSYGAGAGAAEGVGFLIGRYHDKLERTSVPVPLVAGAVLKLGALMTDAVTRGRGRRIGMAGAIGLGVLNAVADASTQAFFVLDGVARGHASANRQLMEGPKGGALPAGARRVDRLWGQPQGQTQVGYIPPVDEGDWMDGAGLRHFAGR